MLRRAFRIDKTGKISNLKLVTEELPLPSPNEVTIRVKAIGLNFADVFMLFGIYSATPKESFVPGLEYSGIIEFVGDNVKNYSPGDKIYGLIKIGAYTDFLNIDAGYIRKLPDNFSFEEGAAFPVNSLTAFYALNILGAAESSQTVLIHSAAGGVGIYANRIAKIAGMRTLGTVGNPGKIEVLKNEGYNDFIIRDKNFKQSLLEKTKETGLHLILESIGGKILKQGFSCLSPSGRMVVFGAANFASPTDRLNPFSLIYKYFTRPQIDPLRLTDKNRSILGFNLIWLWNEKEKMHQYLEQIENLNLKNPLISNTFPFKDLPAAVKLFQSGKTIGKVVITLD